MKGMYSGNEDWLSRQRWIPIVLVAVALIGGWTVGSQRKAIADKDSEAQLVQPMAAAPAAGAKVEPVSAVQSQPTTAATASPATGTGKRGKRLGDAARRVKQHKACLELAKDNPSIICK
jgi:hypothetical protein